MVNGPPVIVDRAVVICYRADKLVAHLADDIFSWSSDQGCSSIVHIPDLPFFVDDGSSKRVFFEHGMKLRLRTSERIHHTLALQRIQKNLNNYPEQCDVLFRPALLMPHRINPDKSDESPAIDHRNENG